MFSELPVQSAVYDHANGQVRFFLAAAADWSSRQLTLLVQGQAYSCDIRRFSGKSAGPAQMVAIFDRVRLQSVTAPLVLTGHVNGAAAAFQYWPERHKLLHWEHGKLNAGELTLLLSYPRSGSNFLQNVLRHNSKLGCASVYQMGRRAAEAKFCLKSHAIDPATLRRELQQIWGIKSRPRRKIILVRDPRDVFISLYDYVKGHRGTETRPAQFLRTDYYWYLFQPDVLNIIRDGSHARSQNVLQAYRQWYQSWCSDGANQDDTVFIRFEDLIRDPDQALAPVFDLIGEPQPKLLEALHDMVSQNGQSRRGRGRAQGWRQAPQAYAPIIKAVSQALKDEIAVLGYQA